MGRYSTVLSGLTTSTNFLSWSVPTARSLTTVAWYAAPPTSFSRANSPGANRWFGFGKTARARTVPLRGSSWLSKKST